MCRSPWGFSTAAEDPAFFRVQTRGRAGTHGRCLNLQLLHQDTWAVGTRTATRAGTDMDSQCRSRFRWGFWLEWGYCFTADISVCQVAQRKSPTPMKTEVGEINRAGWEFHSATERRQEKRLGRDHRLRRIARLALFLNFNRAPCDYVIQTHKADG